MERQGAALGAPTPMASESAGRTKANPLSGNTLASKECCGADRLIPVLACRCNPRPASLPYRSWLAASKAMILVVSPGVGSK